MSKNKYKQIAEDLGNVNIHEPEIAVQQLTQIVTNLVNVVKSEPKSLTDADVRAIIDSSLPGGADSKE